MKKNIRILTMLFLYGVLLSGCNSMNVLRDEVSTMKPTVSSLQAEESMASPTTGPMVISGGTDEDSATGPVSTERPSVTSKPTEKPQATPPPTQKPTATPKPTEKPTANPIGMENNTTTPAPTSVSDQTESSETDDAEDIQLPYAP